MLRHPKTLPAGASIDDSRAALGDDHLHMVLLTDGSTLVGTVTRDDLPQPGVVDAAAIWSRLADRTVQPDASAAAIEQMLVHHGLRRVAVVDAAGSLLGLMCLKQRGSGFCSAADVPSRCRHTGPDPTESE